METGDNEQVSDQGPPVRQKTKVSELNTGIFQQTDIFFITQSNKRVLDTATSSPSSGQFAAGAEEDADSDTVKFKMFLVSLQVKTSS